MNCPGCKTKMKRYGQVHWGKRGKKKTIYYCPKCGYQKFK